MKIKFLIILFIVTGNIFAAEDFKNIDEDAKKNVNRFWFRNKKQENFVLKLFSKTENGNKYKSKDGIQIELEVKEDNKTGINMSDEIKDKLKTDTGKWALFEIKYKEKGAAEDKFVYLYCSDIESVSIDAMSLYGMFQEKTNILNISVLACDTSSVTNMSFMFEDCYRLENLDLSNFDTKNVEKMQFMFGVCKNLKNLNVQNFSIKSISSLCFIFFADEELKEIDLSEWNFSEKFTINKKGEKTTIFKSILRGTSFEKIILKNKNINEEIKDFLNEKSFKLDNKKKDDEILIYIKKVPNCVKKVPICDFCCECCNFC